MEETSPSLRRSSLAVGVLLIFLLTWPLMLANAGVLPFKIPFILGLFTGWGASIAALLVTGFTQGRPAVSALLKRFLIWRVSWKWYGVALLLFPVIMLLSVWTSSILSARPVDFSTVMAHQIFGPAAVLPIYVLPFFFTDLISNGEELGWRGFVLPRLQSRYGALTSSLVLGVIWAVWHLPILLAPGNSSPAVLFVIKIVVEAVLYTWLYNSTRGSLLLVALFHSAGNTAGVFLPVSTTISGGHADTLVIQIGLEILAAAAIVLTQGAGHLTRAASRQAPT